jgi:RNA polymerase sigma-70 factor (ECF subfamily)
VDYKALPPTDLVLHCLRTGEESAWIEFVRRFQPLIASVALRVARQWGQASSSVVDDMVQETYLKLCTDRLRLLRNFKSSHEGAIYGYIKVFAANLAHDHFKASHAQKRGGAVETASMNDEPRAECAARMEPADVLLERRLLVGKVAACLEGMASGQTGDRDRRIFWLYYRAGLSATAIATLPTIGLSTKGVESTILRLTRAVRHRLTARMKKDPTSTGSLEGIKPENSL